MRSRRSSIDSLAQRTRLGVILGDEYFIAEVSEIGMEFEIVLYSIEELEKIRLTVPYDEAMKYTGTLAGDYKALLSHLKIKNGVVELTKP